MKNWYKKGEELIKQIQNTLPGQEEVALWYFGQCGFMIKWNTVSLMIDPVLSDLRDDKGVTMRLYEPPFLPEACRCDYILCTHKHADHMAKETILPIMNQYSDTRIIVPEACASILVEWGIDRNRILSADEKREIELGKITILPISTAHPTHSRDEKGRIRNLAYCIRLGDVHILHLGDTYLTDKLWEDLKELPEVNILMVPINGRDYFRDKNNIIGNMEPEEASKLAQGLHSDLTIPMHYDMVQGNTSDPIRFIRSYMEITNSRAKWKLPALGEQIIYRKS